MKNFVSSACRTYTTFNICRNITKNSKPKFLQRSFDDPREKWNSKPARRLKTIEQFFDGVPKSGRNQIFDEINFHCLDS